LSSNEQSTIDHDNSDIDSIIANVKLEFKNFLIKRDQLMITLGKAFERIVSKPESICREIKGTLREEIAQGLITTRAIELHCPDEWKKNTRPKKEKNENLSISRQEQLATPRVLVDTYGNSEIEPAATSDDDPNNVVNCEGSTNLEYLCIDRCPRCKELEDVIKKSTSFTSADEQFSEQAKVVELETKIEKLESDLQSEFTKNSVLHIRIKELESKQEVGLPHSNQEDKSFEVQFQVPFEDLRMYMSTSLSKNNAVSKVSFSANVDVVNRKLTDIQIG
jgi:phage FluMu protein Com